MLLDPECGKYCIVFTIIFFFFFFDNYVAAEIWDGKRFFLNKGGKYPNFVIRRLY